MESNPMHDQEMTRPVGSLCRQSHSTERSPEAGETPACPLPEGLMLRLSMLRHPAGSARGRSR
ncbi:hypothetical protein PSRA_1029 [Pseudoscardovia radai]|uniref:Uncharacterized protein n=1 Tax=Pseudoscardovia radai TaxID=987066 RepID=A0A261EXP8_9BIFI|nr:hypothetical protein PSRA_1029 [Pseudoscardovia radai]